jgi:hypothetical protein
MTLALGVATLDLWRELGDASALAEIERTTETPEIKESDGRLEARRSCVSTTGFLPLRR